MHAEDRENINPSQLFEQEGDVLERLFHKKAPKMPKKIAKYQVVGELGRGGMGCVYKAYDPSMEIYIALKVMLAVNKSQEREGQRFIREGKAMAKMNHPNIVKVYITGIDNNIPFIAMDYIEGISLQEYLKNTALDIRQFCKLMIKIGSAVQYAHELGIIHRDLKPANIMVDKKLEPYVMDFGLAKVTSVDASLSKKGAILGTPRYMAPEQAKGQEVNHLIDVYALGAIFYEEYTKAIADFTQAININPKYSLAYNNRGNAYLDIKEYTKAAADYTQTIILKPTTSLAYINRGRVYLHFRQFQKAYQDFQIFLKLAPNHSQAPKVRFLIKKIKKEISK